MIASDLMYYLQEKGFGTVNVNLFLAFEPDLPNDCITVFDEQGPTIPESDSLQVDMFGVQILVRNNNYDTAINILYAIHKAIVGFGGSALVENGDIVSYITVSTPPASIGKDTKGRNQTTGHYNVRVQSKNDTYRL